MAKPPEEYHIRAVKRAMHLISLFQDHGPSLGVSEIASLMEIHKSVAHKLLVTLESDDWVSKNPDTDKYSLGLSLLKLSLLVPHQFNFRHSARSIMEELVEQANETVSLNILDNHYRYAICIDLVECNHSVRMTRNIGSHYPLHAGATGKTLAAHMSENQIEELLNSNLIQYTNNTITTPDELKINLFDIKNKGYAVSDGEIDDGLVGIGAPILDGEGNLVAGLSISGPEYRFKPEDKMDKLIKLVKEKAKRLSDISAVSNNKTF